MDTDLSHFTQQIKHFLFNEFFRFSCINFSEIFIKIRRKLHLLCSYRSNKSLRLTFSWINNLSFQSHSYQNTFFSLSINSKCEYHQNYIKTTNRNTFLKNFEMNCFIGVASNVVVFDV